VNQINTVKKLDLYMKKMGVPERLQRDLSYMELYEVLLKGYNYTGLPSTVKAWCEERDSK
jgi:hypothetical protein